MLNQVDAILLIIRCQAGGSQQLLSPLLKFRCFFLKSNLTLQPLPKKSDHG